jgi:hypothetical protein
MVLFSLGANGLHPVWEKEEGRLSVTAMTCGTITDPDN